MTGTDTADGLNAILSALQADRPLYGIDWERHLAEAISRLTALSLPGTAREKARAIEQELHVRGINFDNNRRLALEIISQFFTTSDAPDAPDAPSLPASSHQADDVTDMTGALPLPADVARLITDFEDAVQYPHAGYAGSREHRAIAALRALAQDNERLKERISELYRAQKNMFLSLRASGNKIAELTAPPLPADIAGLEAALCSLIGDPAVDVALSPALLIATNALRALVRENERLKKLANAEEMACWERAANRIVELEGENVRLEAAAAPVCIGPPLIGILAKEGTWRSSTGQCIVAADELRGSDPYERIRELEAEAQTHLNAYQQLFNKETVALERIRGFEAENDALHESVNAVRAEYLQRYMDASARADELMKCVIKVKAERDAWKQTMPGGEFEAAIRAKTFEECAQIAERSACDELLAGAEHAAAAIRARAQTGKEGET